MPVADEVWRLQRGDDPECMAFQAMANQGHYRAEGGTRQGIYVCTPGGEFLTSINSNSAEAVAEVMDRGLAMWRALSTAERASASAATYSPVHRFESSWPSGGLVLVVTLRDLPASGHAPEAASRWNRDHAWFTAEEARRWLPEEIVSGATYPLPRDLALRLARFHIVDSVRGQSVPFARPEVLQAQFDLEVTEREGARVRLNIRGTTHAHAEGPWLMEDESFKPAGGREYVHGVRAEVVGTAVFDLDAGRFVEMEIVARAESWGSTENNGRRLVAEKRTIGLHFQLEAADAVTHVAPAFVEVYDAPWINMPLAGQ